MPSNDPTRRLRPSWNGWDGFGRDREVSPHIPPAASTSSGPCAHDIYQKGRTPHAAFPISSPSLPLY
jgi:hypothetical protein